MKPSLWTRIDVGDRQTTIVRLSIRETDSKIGREKEKFDNKN